MNLTVRQLYFEAIKVGDELPLRARLRLDERLRRLLRVERGEHRLLLGSGQLLERVGQVLGRQLAQLAAVEGDVLGASVLRAVAVPRREVDAERQVVAAARLRRRRSTCMRSR